MFVALTVHIWAATCSADFCFSPKKYIECYRLLWDTVSSHASSTRPDYRFMGVESLYILLNIEIMKVELG